MFEKKPAVDKKTGEISENPPQVPGRAIQKPRLAGALTVSQVAGENPTVFNLRDHPEFDGQKIAIVNFKESAGEFGPFVILDVWTVDGQNEADKHIIIMTGSENVYARVLSCQDSIKSGAPVIGTLRNSGDAWFID